MSRTNVFVLNDFLIKYQNAVPYVPKTRTLQLTLSPSFVPPSVTNYAPIGDLTGPTGPHGKDALRFSSATTNPVVLVPTSPTVSFTVGTRLAYIYGTPVYVSNTQLAAYFTGVILAYNSVTGFMTIGKITGINGVFDGMTPYVYNINVNTLVSIGDIGPQGPMGVHGADGSMGPTGPTGPLVPFSGGNAALIAAMMFQIGFDCGDVD
jgi:hypothetical protein